MHPFLILLLGMAVVVGGVLLFRLHAFVALLLGALVVAFATDPAAVEAFGLAQGLAPDAARALAGDAPTERVASGFGRTCGQIGIVIAMASIIGACLLESGAADRIVRAALRLVGERRAAAAFTGSSFLLAVPVFFDTVFYLMIPLAKTVHLRTGRHYLFYILAIVAGGTMAHTLVPPTPGPLFMATELGIDLGVMIVGGTLVGLFTAGAGYAFARWASRRWELPLREPDAAVGRLRALAARDEASLPPLALALLPILLPVVLITARAVVEAAGAGGAGPVGAALVLLGEKNLALILGAAIALVMLLRTATDGQVQGAVKDALVSAGVIILIIGAGGAFGYVLQQTGIGPAIETLSEGYRMAVLPLAFVLTAIVRTAQGSATVAMITAAGAFAGVADGGQLGFHPLYLALVIGCGSKLVWWMNDSGFWIISQMSGMTEREGLQWLTPTLAVMGVAGLVVVLLAAALFPLV